MATAWHAHLAGARFGAANVPPAQTFVVALGHAVLRSDGAGGAPCVVYDDRGRWVAQVRVGRTGLVEVREHDDSTAPPHVGRWRPVAWRDLEEAAGVLPDLERFLLGRRVAGDVRAELRAAEARREVDVYEDAAGRPYAGGWLGDLDELFFVGAGGEAERPRVGVYVRRPAELDAQLALVLRLAPPGARARYRSKPAPNTGAGEARRLRAAVGRSFAEVRAVGSRGVERGLRGELPVRWRPQLRAQSSS